MTSHPSEFPLGLEAAYSALALRRREAQETVMPFTRGLRGHASTHEQITREELVRRLADIKLMKEDPAGVEKNADAIKKRYAEIFKV